MLIGQRIINAILWPLVRLLLPWDVQGVENLPSTGPVLVLMNHINFLDVIVPAFFLRRDVVMLSKIENFRLPVLGFFIWAHGALSVRRGEPDLQALRRSLAVLKRGRVLCIAPEGTRSGHGRLQRGFDGAAYVGVQAGAPVVPMVSYGHEHFVRNLLRLRRTRWHIRVGEPFRFVSRDRRLRDDLRPMTDEAMYRMAALLPPEYRGVYADLDRVTYEHTAPWSEGSARGMA